MRIISAIELEKYIVGASIFGIVIGKLCYKQKQYLLILLEVDKDLKVSFYYTVLSLDWAIYLRMESN